MAKQKSAPVSVAMVFGHPVHFLAFGFGSGLAPKAPGTFGTLAAIPVYWLLSHLDPSLYVLATALVCIVGIWICGESSRRLGVHDHGGIVWDEIAGYLITMIAAPVTLPCVLLGFVLFRVFDIFKPWPISVIDQKIHGGLGIMLDDIFAGIFAFISLQAILLFFPDLGSVAG